jgi:spore germination protein YaaH
VDPHLGPAADPTHDVQGRVTAASPARHAQPTLGLLRRPVRLLRGVASHRTAVSLACAVLVVALLTTVGLSAHRGGAVALSTGTAAKQQHDEAGGLDLAALAAMRGLSKARLADLPAATKPPAAAPPSLASAATLRPHEVFGFAPYWTLAQSAGFNVSGISTLAYFSVGVNPDGSLAESGAGWNGYESQALANLVTRAHAAGDRVVLTVNNFDQGQLDALTSSPTAPATLAAALVRAVSAKNLDGVNLDFEGGGDRDQAGLTRLVTTVSAALHGANPHYQVTMDTYGSSASGTNGWFNLPALAPAVDAFFIMEYNPNLAASQSSTSPLTSGMFSDQTALNEYAAVLPPSKVILGLPYFGLDWPTSNGTLTATATGPATTVSLGDILASGHPQYWDATTDSGWTSYQVGAQWHETFFEDPVSLYAAATLAQSRNLAGVGIWALGMDGNNGADLFALLGFAPAVKGGLAGPAVTSSSPPPAGPVPTTPSPTNATPPPTTAPPFPVTTTTTTTATTPPSTTTTTATTTTTTSTTTTTTPPTSSGVWNGVRTSLTEVTAPNVPTMSGSAPAGLLYGFTTNDPALSCLGAEPSLNVWAVSGNTHEFVVLAATPDDCMNADFVLTTP